MSRLFSDLQDGSGQQYYFGLNAAPGGISPATGGITVQGRAPNIFVHLELFRTPATALITIRGVDFLSGLIAPPAQAALAINPLVPTLVTNLVVTPAQPLDYTDLPDNAPTIAFIETVSPAPATLTLQSLEFNLTQGGNIGFVAPGRGLVTMQTFAPSLIFFDAVIGTVSVVGHTPALVTEAILDVSPTPQGSMVSVIGHAPTLVTPFTWVDVDAPPVTQWTTTTGIAA